MDYVQITEPQRRQMLQTIGVKSMEELFSTLPPAARLNRPLKMPPAMSELELQRRIAEFAGRNRAGHQASCFMGCGAYDHFIPSLIDNLIGSGKFLTAYTPYQAEASQGSLQAFFEFQTQVCRLTGLDIANASLYEGATAVSEAVYMAFNHTMKSRVLVASTLHPHYRQVLATACSDLPIDLIEIPFDKATGRVDPRQVQALLDDNTAAVVIQSPNMFGVIEEWQAHFDLAHSKEKTLGVAVFNPIASGLLGRPGDCGADIAAGDGQPLGIPMGFGGPWLGLFAAREALMRRMPGRLIGQTTDSEGRRGFCLTLQTREQHIRGAKATSNVCTNQGLLALRATVYLSTLGPAGIADVASQCYHKAHYAEGLITKIPGYKRLYSGEFFHEFMIACPVPAAKIIDLGRQRGILPGIDGSQPGLHGLGEANHLLIAVTEKRTRQEIENLVSLLKEAAQ